MNISHFRKNKKLIFAFTLLLIVIFIFKTLTAKAYPSAWDRYTHTNVNDDIYYSEENTMNKYNIGYKLVPDFNELAHGEGNKYTNLTIDDKNKLMSKWYVSGYGPFLNYATNNISNSEALSYSFCQNNGLFNNSNYVYIASNQESLADAKSVAMYYSDTFDIKPLLINSDYNKFSSTILRALDDNKIKNAVVVGGGLRLDNMFGIGSEYNTVRIGGEDRNVTYRYLTMCEAISSRLYNIDTMPELKDNYICDIRDKGTLNNDKIMDIKLLLQNNRFQEAAQIVLREDIIGSENNIQNGDYALMIGCKAKSAPEGKAKFLIVYYMHNTGNYPYGVYQYIGEDYFKPEPKYLPKADISVQPYVAVGDDVTLYASGSSDDESVSSLNGEIKFTSYNNVGIVRLQPYKKEYDVNIPGKKNINFDGVVFFTEEGNYKVYSEVTDNYGNVGESDIKTITAYAPVPTVTLDKTGTEKENRKITIDASRSYGGSKRFPINWSKAKWEITALNGSSIDDIRVQKHTEGETNGEILIDSSRGINKSLNGLDKFDILLKKPGQYKIKCTLFNTYKEGKSSYEEIVLNIIPDEPPITNLFLTPVIFRDKNNKNSKGLSQATQVLVDDSSINNGSYSKDGDTINKRLWLYTHDANNNGNFDDDPWYAFYSGTWNKVADNYSQLKNININNYPCGNMSKVNLIVDYVGNYDVHLIAQEEFGQATIPQFVTANDRKTGNTFYK